MGEIDVPTMDILEVIDKVRFIVEDLEYILNDPNYRFCGGERELTEANYKLFTQINQELKSAKIY